MNIKKGDIVKVMTGKDRAKNGKVLQIFAETNRVLVEGVNMMKKNMKPKKQGQKGEVVSISRSIDASNVMMVCTSCKAAARIGHRVEKEVKVRYCKKCNATLN